MRLAIVRTGQVLDPERRHAGELLPPFKLGVGGPLAGGEPVHLLDPHRRRDRDPALGARQRGRQRRVNATAPNPVTNREFSKALGRALAARRSMPVPGFVLDLKFGGEFGAVLRGGQRVMPRRALDLGYEFRYPELDEALRNLL